MTRCGVERRRGPTTEFAARSSDSPHPSLRSHRDGLHLGAVAPDEQPNVREASSPDARLEYVGLERETPATPTKATSPHDFRGSHDRQVMLVGSAVVDGSAGSPRQHAAPALLLLARGDGRREGRRVEPAFREGVQDVLKDEVERVLAVGLS